MVGASGRHIWDLALRLLSEAPKGRLLEVAAGGGFLSHELVKLGYEVSGSDLVNQWRFPEIPFLMVDLDKPLPFEAESFDVIVFTEGLGYLENVQEMLRQFRRALKPGGVIVITIPNVFSLQSRLKFLFSGSFSWFPHPQIREGCKEQFADVYRDPTRLTTLNFYLERAGFSLERIEFGGGKALPFLAPFGMFLQFLTSVENRLRKKRKTPTIVNSFPALLYTNVGVLARTTDVAVRK